jgi:hypothetical protein
LEYGGSASDTGNIPFTQQAKQVLTFAWDEARKLGHNYVNVEHLFLATFRDPASIAARVLSDIGLNPVAFKEELLKLLGNKLAHPSQKSQPVVATPTLDLYGRDLTSLAAEGHLDPVIGRQKEIERIIQIICRRTKNNPVLTGEPGVGKTAIVECLAQKIVCGDVPDRLRDKRVVSLDLGLLVAGTKYRGEFEDRVKKVMEEVRKAFDAAGVCWGEYQDYRQMATQDPRCSPANPMFRRVAQPGIGELTVPGSPLNFSGAERTAFVAPRAGEHTDAILAEVIGLSSGKIGELHDRRIVGGLMHNSEGKTS